MTSTTPHAVLPQGSRQGFREEMTLELCIARQASGGETLGGERWGTERAKAVAQGVRKFGKSREWPKVLF